MEFRYRANDGDRPPPATDTTPPYQSLNPNSSFLSVSGGQSEEHVREAIKREIEKEQIRQEIISAETARRRELIAEVVQEMAIEREMAIRRVAETTMGTSLPLLINQRKLPIQNQSSDLFRQKCSYSDPLMYTGGPYSLATTSPMMQIPEATGAKETSKMESNKEKLIVLERADPVGAEDTETGLERGKRKADGKQVETVLDAKRRRKFKFWCDVCSVGAYSETVMRNHELGKKHQAAIEKRNEPPKTAAATASSSLITAPASVTAPQSEAVTVLENASVEDRKVDEMEKTEGEKKKTVIRCETCDVVANSEKMMEIHKLGKKHKALLKKQYPKQVIVETQKAE